MYGEDVLTERQCQNGFAIFRSANFDVEVPARSGRPVDADEGKNKAFIDTNCQKQLVRSPRLNGSNFTIHDHVETPLLENRLSLSS